MKREEIEEKVSELIVDHLSIPSDQINDTSLLVDELGMDSLDSLELTIELEEIFEIDIPDEKIGDMITFKDIVDYIEKRVNR